MSMFYLIKARDTILCLSIFARVNCFVNSIPCTSRNSLNTNTRAIIHLDFHDCAKFHVREIQSFFFPKLVLIVECINLRPIATLSTCSVKSTEMCYGGKPMYFMWLIYCLFTDVLFRSISIKRCNSPNSKTNVECNIRLGPRPQVKINWFGRGELKVLGQNDRGHFYQVSHITVKCGPSEFKQLGQVG